MVTMFNAAMMVTQVMVSVMVMVIMAILQLGAAEQELLMHVQSDYFLGVGIYLVFMSFVPGKSSLPQRNHHHHSLFVYHFAEKFMWILKAIGFRENRDQGLALLHKAKALSTHHCMSPLPTPPPSHHHHLMIRLITLSYSSPSPSLQSPSPQSPAQFTPFTPFTPFLPPQISP